MTGPRSWPTKIKSWPFASSQASSRMPGVIRQPWPGWSAELKAQSATGVPKFPEHATLVEEARLLRDVHSLLDQCIDNPALARAQPPKTAAGLLELRAIALARSGRAATGGGGRRRTTHSAQRADLHLFTRLASTLLSPRHWIDHRAISNRSISRPRSRRCGRRSQRPNCRLRDFRLIRISTSCTMPPSSSRPTRR